MIKGTPERINGRREEIINACERLYQTMSFKDITLIEIGKAVPFSRPTIYNYFVTKEEIFLALFQREYDRWNEQLSAILDRDEQLTAFKRSYGGSMQRMRSLLEKYRPEMGPADIQNFIYTFFPFMFGIYPYTAVTEKQKTAMKDAGIDYVYQSVYELTYSCLIRLLSSGAGR